MTDHTTVTRDDDRSRYEIAVDGAVAGFAAFVTDRRGRVVVTHTEIDPAYKGQGLGSILADGALTDLAGRGEVVVPRCPFIAHYLTSHEVEGLVVDAPASPDAAGSDDADAPAADAERPA